LSKIKRFQLALNALTTGVRAPRDFPADGRETFVKTLGLYGGTLFDVSVPPNVFDDQRYVEPWHFGPKLVEALENAGWRWSGWISNVPGETVSGNSFLVQGFGPAIGRIDAEDGITVQVSAGQNSELWKSAVALVAAMRRAGWNSRLEAFSTTGNTNNNVMHILIGPSPINLR
jgi:hypothetical protein